MKFGGIATSTSKNREKIASIIEKINHKKILLVVSAMGRVGFPYATDTLLELIDSANITIKEENRLLSIGEIISSIVMSNLLNSKKIKAYALSLKEIGLYKKDKFVFENSAITELFNSYNVLIVPGFIALDNKENVITLKRGGGDLSACILTNFLNCTTTYLFKDVSGVLPFVSQGYNNIKPIKYLSYLEALALTNIGYNIIQKAALIYAKESNLEIVVTNYVNGKIGTVIGKNELNKHIIGMNFTKNTIKIATLFPELADEQIKKNFSNNHLFFKNFKMKKDYVEYEFGINQIQLAKKMLIDTYFKDYL